MKKVMKIVGIIVLVIIILAAVFFIKAAFTPAVPKDYTETVKTGGEIEAKYLKSY